MSDVPTMKRGRLIYGCPQPDTHPDTSRTPIKYRVLPNHIKKIKSLLGNGKSVRFIASKLCIPRSTIHDSIIKYSLQCKGNVGSGVSELSGKCPDSKPLKRSSDFTFEVHNYQASIEIKSKPVGWSINKIMGYRNMDFQTIHRNGWDEYFFPFNDASVHITTNKIIIFPPKIQSKVSAEDCQIMASKFVLELRPKIEKLLELKLSKNHILWIDVSRQHSVLFNDKVWDKLRELGFEKIKDDGGHIRLMLDQSNGEKHIESLHPTESEKDIDSIYELFRLNMNHEPLNPNRVRGHILEGAKNSLILQSDIKILKDEIDCLKKDNKPDDKVDDDMSEVDYFG